MDRAHRIHALRAMLDSPGWAEVLAPEIQKRLDNLVYRVLAGRASDSEAQSRSALGEAAMGQWVLSWPRQQIEDFQLELEAEIRKGEEEADVAKAEEHYLRYGHHAPILEDLPASEE